jgi:hypothetical protein
LRPHADFRVDRVEGHGPDFDEEVARAGFRARQVDVDEGILLIDGEGLLVTDGAHGMSPVDGSIVEHSVGSRKNAQKQPIVSKRVP